MGRVIEAFSQFLDGAGDPLSMGWLEFLEAGSNNTLKDTFYDSLYQGKNSNPVRLDAEGRCPDVFGRGSYRVISYENDPADETNPGAQVQVKDPVLAAVDSVSSGGGGGFQTWSAIETYQQLDIVTYSGIYYRSLIIDNINNTPSLEPFAWENIEFLSIWNETVTYNIGDLVRYDENLYFSSQGGNINNRPDISPSFWRRIDSEVVAVTTQTDDYTILTSERDYLVILGSGTAATKTFTLPILNSTYSGFRLWICNDSDYDLTILPGAGNGLWIDVPVQIVIQKAAHLELRYCSSTNRWAPQNNVGSVLGGQDIGTETLPCLSLWATDIETDNITVETMAFLPDDTPLYFGDANDASLIYNSATSSLDFSSTETIKIDTSSSLALSADTGISLDSATTLSIDSIGAMTLTATGDITADTADNLSIDYINHFYIFRNGVLFWDFQDDGKILPGGSNANAWLGTSSNPIDEMHMGTNARIWFGAGDYFRISHDGSNAYLSNSVGNIYFYNGPGVNLAGYISPTLNFHPNNNFYMREDKFLYFGESEESYINYTGLTNGMAIGTTTNSPVRFIQQGNEKWRINTLGHLEPATNKTYSIGTSSNNVKSVNTDALVADTQIFTPKLSAPSGSGLILGIQGGDLSNEYFNIYSLGTSGSDFIIYVTFQGTNYKLTATPV